MPITTAMAYLHHCTVDCCLLLLDAMFCCSDRSFRVMIFPYFAFYDLLLFDAFLGFCSEKPESIFRRYILYTNSRRLLVGRQPQPLVPEKADSTQVRTPRLQQKKRSRPVQSRKIVFFCCYNKGKKRLWWQVRSGQGCL